MIGATLRALTWGTLVTAVISALLLAVGEAGMPRAESSETTPTRPATTTAAGTAAAHGSPAGSVARTGPHH